MLIRRPTCCRWRPSVPSLLCASLLLLLAAIGSARASSVYIMDSESDAAQVRVDLVRESREEIYAAYFIYDDDATGLAGLYLLREAARRGLDVRLIVDAQWNKVAKPLVKHLIEEGVRIRLYHKFSLFKPFWWTRRMHDKLLITDGWHLVAGGRNIENPYFGLGEHKYTDRDVYVLGETAAEARRYFLGLWESRHVGEPRVRRVPPGKVAEASRRIDAGRKILEDSPIVDWESGTEWRASSVEVGEVEFLHDEVARKRKRPGIRTDLVEILESAGDRVVLESPYLVVTRGLRNSLQRLIDRGVRVRILTNSLQSTDNVYPQAGYVGKKKKLVRMGVELWEYTGPRTLHSKSAALDGTTVIIGSYNLDPRSERLNTEIAVVFRDESLASAIEQSMQANLGHAWRIGPDGKPLGHDRRYPGVGTCKRIKIRLIRLLLPLIRGQL